MDIWFSSWADDRHGVRGVDEAMQHFRFDGLPVDVKSEDVVQYYAKYEAGGQWTHSTPLNDINQVVLI